MSNDAAHSTIVSDRRVFSRLDFGATSGQGPGAKSGPTALRRYWLFVFLVAAAGIALRFPALQGTLLADDWDHYAMSEHIYPVELPAWDMFRFVGASAGEKRALLDSGRLPWWSAPHLHLAVFRPLSSLLIYADFTLLGGHRHPAVLHLHSMVWWLVLLAAVAALYARLLPLPVAAIALLIYAVDDAHVYPEVWIANRSELVSVGLMTWALYAHVVAGEASRSVALRVMAILLAALALLAGEHAVAPLCYLFTFELFNASVSWRTRIRRIAPYALVALTYTAVRATLRYGVAGSGFYVDPAAEPARYLRTALTRVPLLAGDLVFGLPAEWWSWGVPWRVDRVAKLGLAPPEWLSPVAIAGVQVALGVAALVGTVTVGWYCLRSGRSGKWHREHAALLFGACLSLVPLAGTASMTRLTVAPAVAFDAVFGYALWVLLGCLSAKPALTKRVVCGVGAFGILWLHVARASSFSFEGALRLTNSSHLEYGWTTKADFGAADVKQRHVFIISARDMATQYLLPYTLHAAGLPAPRTAHLLSPAAQNAHVLTRIDSNVLDVQFPERITDKPFIPMVYREAGSPFYPGQRYGNAFFEVEVKSVRGGQPRHLRFTFRKPLHDRSYLFMYPTERGIKELRLPPMGQSIRLGAPAWPQ